MSTRTRTQSNAVTKQKLVQCWYRWLPDPNWYPYKSQVNTFLEGANLYEFMTDVIGNFGKENECTHTKVGVHDNPSSFWDVTYNGTSPGLSFKFSVSVSVGYELTGFQTHLSQEVGLASLARARVPVYMNQSSSMALNIYELDDTVNAGATRFVLALAGLAAAVWRRQPTKKKRKALKKQFLTIGGVSGLVRVLMNADMEWKYGWKPFLTDLTASMDCFKRASKIEAKVMQGTRVYGFARASQESSFPEEACETGDLWNSTVKYSKVTTTRCTASIKRRYRKDTTGGDIMLDRIALLQEDLGIKASLKLAWQVVPLSFVVDWFLPIADWIESQEGAATPPMWLVDSYDGCESTKVTTVIHGTVTYVSNDVRAAGSTIRASGSLEIEDYSRAPSSLTGTSPAYIPHFRTPQGWGKWWSMLELALQRKLR